MSVKPLPRITAETRPYWEACAAGDLQYQWCRDCRRAQFYPRVACARCGGRALDWRRSAGCGVVHAVSVVHRAPSPAFRADVPYAIALVDLDEGFRMMANIVGADPARVAIGDRVRLVFEQRGEVALPQFTPEA
ncbi:MAG: Zn-ribbon domain-containing OB-fold protein [Candidatus Rokubacteria bacterium]|nr:Zn-ribbon domain-containing OB-fold protein [Candidatus Rokubacteria bacterium]